jgi:hypothetical protein
VTAARTTMLASLVRILRWLSSCMIASAARGVATQIPSLALPIVNAQKL